MQNPLAKTLSCKKQVYICENVNVMSCTSILSVSVNKCSKELAVQCNEWEYWSRELSHDKKYRVTGFTVEAKSKVLKAQHSSPS